MGIGFETHGHALRSPVVPHAGRQGRFPEHSADLRRQITQCPQVLARDTDGHRDTYRGARLELPHINPGTRNLRIEGALQRADERTRVMLVVDLDEYLRVVQLWRFWCGREPEARTTAADECRQRL